MDIMSYVAAFFTALLTVYCNYKYDEIKLKKAFIDELEINKTILKSLLGKMSTGQISIFPPLFSTVAYEDLRRKGLFYNLPKELRNNIVSLYLYMNELNEIGRAMTFGLIRIKDQEKFKKNLLRYIDLNNEILVSLKRRWKILKYFS